MPQLVEGETTVQYLKIFERQHNNCMQKMHYSQNRGRGVCVLYCICVCMHVWLDALVFQCNFFAIDTSLLTMSGFRQDLSQLTMLPYVLKILSEGELVACMHKYFLAMLLSQVKWILCVLHHRRGSFSLWRSAYRHSAQLLWQQWDPFFF